MQSLYIGNTIIYKGLGAELEFDTDKAIGFKSKSDIISFPFLVPVEGFRSNETAEGVTHVLVEVFESRLKVTHCRVSEKDWATLQRAKKNLPKLRRVWIEVMRRSVVVLNREYAITKQYYKEDNK